MPRILRTLEADADLDEIWAYVAVDNRTAANELVRKIDEMIRLLANRPDLGTPQFQYRENLRAKLVAKRYLIFYEPFVDGIRVLRIVHGARDWERLI